MDKTPPRPAQLLLAIGFAISCFGLLLFMWTAFGGPVPLGADGYRVRVPFSESGQLATEADVRISGVTVGRVAGIELADQRHAEATLELDAALAPLPADSRAVLRTKTLLGETYIELTPGSREAREIPEGGALAPGRVAQSVELDEVLRTFDSRTRADLRVWLQGSARALSGRAQNLNTALGLLDPFSGTARDLLEILDRERRSVRGLIRDGGTALAAISERRGALRGLITNAEQVFAATAARDRELGETFTRMPGFLTETRRTLAAYDEFADLAQPLLRRLTPAATELDPALRALDDASSPLTRFAAGLRTVARRAPSGLGATRDLIGGPLPPLLEALDPWLDEVTPQIEALRRYRREVTALTGNLAASANAFNRPPEAGFEVSHYLRTVNPLSPESLASFDRRPDSSRTNPYVRPGGYLDLGRGLPSFASGECGAGPTSTLDPASAPLLPGDLFKRLRRFAFAGELSTADLPAPPCRLQGKQTSLGGPPSERTYYPHVNPLP